MPILQRARFSVLTVAAGIGAQEFQHARAVRIVRVLRDLTRAPMDWMVGRRFANFAVPAEQYWYHR